MKINKKKLIKLIIKFVIDNLDETGLDYNIVKDYLYNNKYILNYINKRVNPSIYTNNLLRYDNSVKNALYENNILIDNKGYYNYITLLDKIKIDYNKNKNRLSNIDNLDSYFCPYIELLKLTKQVNKISTKQTKTNERVLNHVFNTNNKLQIVIEDLYKYSQSCNIKININGIYINDNKILIYDKYIDTIISKELKNIIKPIKQEYPLKFFVYFYLFNLLFILIENSYYKDAKYISLKILDIINNKLINKYFYNNKFNDKLLIITKLYDIFYSDKIKEEIYNDYFLINKFYKIYINNEKRNYISFLIGVYKLFTYLNNKYNRKIKNIALELYENQNTNLINKIICFDDATNYNSDLTNAEIISNNEVL
jgi:hypothetical protein